MQGNNPLAQTQMLAAAKDVRTVGTQEVDGVQTTHYTGSYPPSAGLAKLSACRRLGSTCGSTPSTRPAS